MRFGEGVPRGDEVRGLFHIELTEQRLEALDGLAVDREHLVLLHEKLLLGRERADGECGQTVLAQQLAVAVEDHGQLLFSHAVQIPDFVGLGVGMHREEQRLVKLGVERMDEVGELFEAQICGDGVAVAQILLAQLFRVGYGNACCGLKHIGNLLAVMIFINEY